MVAYLTGLGATDPPIRAGEAAPSQPLHRVKLPVTATLGGKSAEVLFAGLTPGFVGLYQVNLAVPQLPAGDHSLVVSVDGVASNAGLVAVSDGK